LESRKNGKNPWRFKEGSDGHIVEIDADRYYQMICEDCCKLDRDKQILCNHVKRTAHWLSSKKAQRLKLLYAADPATAINELAASCQDLRGKSCLNQATKD
jgi:hypothetical protein